MWTWEFIFPCKEILYVIYTLKYFFGNTKKERVSVPLETKAGNIYYWIFICTPRTAPQGLNVILLHTCQELHDDKSRLPTMYQSWI